MYVTTLTELLRFVKHFVHKRPYLRLSVPIWVDRLKHQAPQGHYSSQAVRFIGTFYSMTIPMNF